MAKRKAPEVNAGSMADIAFLLLIFFLVTTTIETDSGINRKLPPMEDQIDPPIIREKNIFTVVVNKNNQLLVEESLTDIKDLTRPIIAHVKEMQKMTMRDGKNLPVYIAGHSLGSLTALNIVLEQPELFEGFIGHYLEL